MKKQPKTAKHIPTKGVDFGEHLKAPGGCDPCRDVSTKQPQGPALEQAEGDGRGLVGKDAMMPGQKRLRRPRASRWKKPNPGRCKDQQRGR